MTFEHSNNVANCTYTKPPKDIGFSFTSQECSKENNICNFNKTVKYAGLKPLPSSDDPLPIHTEICQVFPYGTDPEDFNSEINGDSSELNKKLIVKFNESLHSLSKDKESLFYGVYEGIKIWENYELTGALWVSDIAKSSTAVNNQRGSLALANPVMETSFQNGPPYGEQKMNCFACHNYNGTDTGKSNTEPKPSSLSHIFDDIMCGLKNAEEQDGEIINEYCQEEKIE